MSEVHYFPRYSQKENMVTNNTLLLFKRLYNYSADRYDDFINKLLEDTLGDKLDTSITFHQQVAGPKSTPDAVIEQKSVKIIIETKLHGQENIKQIKNHCEKFKNEDRQLLLLIDKEAINSSYQEKIIHALNEINETKGKNINFSATTFKAICTAFRDSIFEFDREMIELIDDYEAFCTESGLIDNAHTKMRALPVGDTLEQNLQYNIYYAPKERGYQNHTYIGLYRRKVIQAVGEIVCVVDANYDKEQGEVVVDNIVSGEITDEQKESIKHVVLEAKEKYGYILYIGHRFFFVDDYVATKYSKVSKGGLNGQRYFDLADHPEFSEEMTLPEIAQLLHGKEWT